MPLTNNLAEQAVRTQQVKQKVSGGSVVMRATQRRRRLGEGPWWKERAGPPQAHLAGWMRKSAGSVLSELKVWLAERCHALWSELRHHKWKEFAVLEMPGTY